MIIDTYAAAARQNLHFSGVPYALLPPTSIPPAGYNQGQPYWRFGVASNNPVYGVVDLPTGGHGGIGGDGISWSAGSGVLPFEAAPVVALPGIDAGGVKWAKPVLTGSGLGGLAVASPDDGRITGSLATLGQASAMPQGGPSTAPAPRPGGVPLWAWILGGLAVLVVLKPHNGGRG